MIVQTKMNKIQKQYTTSLQTQKMH